MTTKLALILPEILLVVGGIIVTMLGLARSKVWRDAVPAVTVATFAIAGTFAGLAGAIEVIGENRALVTSFSANYGYLGIAVALVALALGAAAAEFFNVLDTVGWASAKFVGIVTCFLFPIAVFWRGELAYPLVTFLLIAAVLSWYLVGAGGPDPRVLEGSGATVLGVMWIGGLGSTAAAMLDLHDGRALFLIAVIATVGYDVGAYFIGKAAGHRPLSSASPNKTVEGLVGGMAVALFLTIILVGALKLGPWDGPAAALVLGIGAACAAPLGDLCQSLLKRDLGVKDMSSFIPGHGGILDRFDSMLFVLPTVFLLYVTLGH